jgi:hypothetical protein
MLKETKKFVSIGEVAKELNLKTQFSDDHLHVFDIKDKFFIGNGCESPIKNSKSNNQPNVSICAEK